MKILDRVILVVVYDSNGDTISNFVVRFSTFSPPPVLSLFVVFIFIQRLRFIVSKLYLLF